MYTLTNANTSSLVGNKNKKTRGKEWKAGESARELPVLSPVSPFGMVCTLWPRGELYMCLCADLWSRGGMVDPSLQQQEKRQRGRLVRRARGQESIS